MTQVRGVADLGEQHAGADVLLLEALDGMRNRPFENVVGEHDDDLVAVGEALGEPQRLGDATGALLIGVQEPVEAPLVAVPEEPEELARMCSPGDQHRLGDAGPDERLDRVRDHGPVVDRQ